MNTHVRVIERLLDSYFRITWLRAFGELIVPEGKQSGPSPKRRRRRARSRCSRCGRR